MVNTMTSQNSTAPQGQHAARPARPAVPESALPSARAAAIKDEAWTRLIAGRAFLIREQPYLASGLFKLRARRTTQVPTLASDAKWRMYWNPDYVLHLPVPQIAAAWEHELSHVTRHATARFEAMHEPLTMLQVWNMACDLPINHDIQTSGLPLGEGWLTFDQFLETGVQPGMTSEQIYSRLKAYMQNNPPQPQCNHQQGDQSQDGDQQGQSCPQCGQPQDGDGNQQQQGGGGMPQPQTNDQYGRMCGSSVGGPAREWEDPSDADAVTPGEAELARQTMARDIANHERTNGRGTVPGGWSQFAQETLNPKIDWKRALRATMRATLSNLSGRVDYTYARPSRRQVPGVVLPALVKPEPPTIEVVVDTSGSVSSADLEQAMGEIEGIYKSQGRGKPLMITMCDVVAHPPQKYTGRISRIQIQGRGGTDMRVGIEAAAKRRSPKNKIIVTITDGYTPWPDEKPRSNPDAVYIAVLFDNVSGWSAPPPWMKTIVIPQDR